MATDLTTTKYEPIQPEGLALALMVTTIVMTILTTIIVALRFYVRNLTHTTSVDDWLMLAGWIINVGHNASACVLAVSGIGSHDDVITVGMQLNLGLWTMIWQFLYVLDGALIKSSIIWAMLRLATQRKYKYILWGLFSLAWITWQISWPVAIFQCKPVAAAWGAVPGDCTSGQTVILNVSYFVSATNIFTDLATALTPILLLRHIQLAPRVKILTMFILSLGVFASVATTIRITYTWAYTTPHDRFYQIGKIVLLTVFECDLGIIAGSLPMLRRLFPSLSPSKSSSSKTPGRSTDVNLVTIGGGGRSGVGRKGYKLENTLDGTRLGSNEQYFQDKEDGPVDPEDSRSTRRMIHVTREIEQTSDSSVDSRGYGNNINNRDNHFQTAVSSGPRKHGA
ncbi:Uu.00g146790.m01.CDS01 [Anthostomella pinea]|uniref:Uu.00g146790.m01.CDS01 n=1 Tax=Anthostomella pinea TaxID=933095 RepID=A0AAI8VRC5_9PEZI|nr:Uu.00g146790.m01.CDS01 [Anthostomella pinea]